MSNQKGIGGTGPPELAALPLPELVDLALAEDVSDDRVWEIEVEIARRGLDEALPMAEELLGAEALSKRCLGAGIMRVLAGSSIEEERATAARLLLGLIETESDPDMLGNAAVGLGKAAEERALEPLVRLSAHPDENVRVEVAYALPDVVRSTLDERGVRALIELSTDPDEDVRDWATFGVGVILSPEPDTPEVRRALKERTEDESFTVRCEALEGLGLRGDIPALAEALRLCDVGIDAVMVAEKAATPELYEPLLALKSRWRPGNIEDVEQAIAACRPEQEGENSA